MTDKMKKAIGKCVKCRHFAGLKKDGKPKACRLKRTMGVIQCHNRAAAQGYYEQGAE